MPINSEPFIYNSDTQTLIVFKMENYTSEDGPFPYCNRPWHSLAEQIKSIIIDDSVTFIGDYAFAYFSNLYSQ